MAVAAVALSGDGFGEQSPGPVAEVVVTLRTPALSVFGRSLQSATHAAYTQRLVAAQNAVVRHLTAAIPAAQVRWRYRLVLDGFAVTLPRSQLAELAHVRGVAKVWPNVRYHSLAAAATPDQIGAPALWGPGLTTAGQGMKIGIIDEGIDAAHPFFNPAGFQYPPGFPKGQTK